MGVGLNRVDIGSVTNALSEANGRILPEYQIAKKEFLSDYGYTGSALVAPVLSRSHSGKIDGSGVIDITLLGISQGDLEDLVGYRDDGTEISFSNSFYSYTVVITDLQESLGNDSLFDVNVKMDVIE